MAGFYPPWPESPWHLPEDHHILCWKPLSSVAPELSWPSLDSWASCFPLQGEDNLRWEPVPAPQAAQVMTGLAQDEKLEHYRGLLRPCSQVNPNVLYYSPI